MTEAYRRGYERASIRAEYDREELEQRIAELEAAMRDLRLTARVLLQNAEGCAYNHHAEDTHQFGEPGWIADSRKTIEAAEKLLST